MPTSISRRGFLLLTGAASATAALVRGNASAAPSAATRGRKTTTTGATTTTVAPTTTLAPTTTTAPAGGDGIYTDVYQDVY